MKRQLLLIILFVSTAFLALSQGNTDIDKLVQARMNYMKENLVLTNAESKDFWGMYEQFLRSEIKYHDTYRKNLSKKGVQGGCPSCTESCATLSDAQILYLYDQKFEIRKNILTLETSFYKKIKNVLTPKHLQDFYKLEERYKRNFVKNKHAQNKNSQNKPSSTTPNKPKR